MNTKKLLIIFALLFLLLPLVSAYNWDNREYYNETTKEYLVKNALGWGDDLSRLQLKTPLQNNIVGIGLDTRIALLNVTIYTEETKTNLFGDMEVYDYSRIDKSTGEYLRSSKTVTWKYKTLQLKDVPNIVLVCKPSNDRVSNGCSYEVQGTKKEIVEVWEEFKDTIPAGNYEVGVYTDTTQGDHMDLIPNIQGTRLDAWFSWIASLNTNLGYYYSFEEPSGSIVFDNSTSKTNGKIVGSPTRLAIPNGKIKRALNFTGSGLQVVNLGTNNTAQCTNNCSFNVWGAISDTSISNYFAFGNDNAGGYAGYGFGVLSTGKLRFTKPGVSTCDTAASVNIISDQWKMFTVTYDGAFATFYVNGTFFETKACTQSFTAGNISLAGDTVNAEQYIGRMDEPSFWYGKNLTQTEINNLYNNYLAIQFGQGEGPSSSSVNVTLVSPSNFFNSSNLNQFFNATFLTTIANLTNATLYIWNSSNSLINQTLNLVVTNDSNNAYNFTTWNVTLPYQGNFSWNVYAFSDNNTGSPKAWGASNFTFTIDSSPPLISFVFPSNGSTFGNATLQLNYTLYDLNPTTCWYTNSSGQVNYTLTCKNNITGGWNQGWNVVTVYANDSLNNVNYSTVSFFVNSIPARVNLTTPVKFANLSSSAQTFQYVVNSTFLSNSTVIIWNSSNSIVFNLTNYTVDVSNITTVNFLFTIPSPGNYTWNVIAVNLGGLSFWSPINSSFTLDITAPNITILCPVSYDIFGVPNNFCLNYTITEDFLTPTCWYSIDYVQNISLPSCLNNTMNATVGDHLLTLYSNNSAGLINQAQKNFTVVNLSILNSYLSPVLEASTVNFTNTVNVSSSVSLSPYFFYNGTDRSDLVMSNYPNYTATLQVPLVTLSQNFLFYWGYNVSYGSNSKILNATSPLNQTVISAQLINCSNSSAILLFSIVDEEFQTAIISNTVEMNFNLLSDQGQNLTSMNISITNMVSQGICLNYPVTANGYTLDGTVKYSGTDFAIEYYEIRDFPVRVNYTTENVVLRDLNLSKSTDFQVTFKGLDFLPQEGVILFLERQYVSEGVFKVVEAPITDSNGQTILHMVRNDIVYNIKAVDNGVLIGFFQNIRAFCQDNFGSCFVTLNAQNNDTNVVSYQNILGQDILFTSEPSFNQTSNLVTLSFISPSGVSQNVTVVIQRNDIFGNQTLCTNSLVASSGTVTCQLSAQFNETSVVTTTYVNGEIVATGVSNAPETSFGPTGYLVWFVLTLVIILMLADSKTFVMFGLAISYIGAVLLGISLSSIVGIGIGLGGAGIWIIVITIAAIYQLNRRKYE